MTAHNTKNWFTTVQLDDCVFGIGEFGHYEEVLSFLIVGEKEAVLIDSGMGFFSMRSEVQKMTLLPCGVLNTHSHFDHIGSNFEFSQVELFDHPTNRQAAQEGYSAEYLAAWFSDQQFWNVRPEGLPSVYTIPSFQQAQFFKDRDVLSRASLNFTVLHTPGHCDDSVCFYESSRGWLFAGDLLYDGPIYIEKNGGLTKYRRSIDLILELNNVRKIFCSHNAFEFPLEKVIEIRDELAKINTAEIEKEVSLGGRLRLIPA